jgi:hypothetical protein
VARQAWIASAAVAAAAAAAAHSAAPAAAAVGKMSSEDRPALSLHGQGSRRGRADATAAATTAAAAVRLLRS